LLNGDVLDVETDVVTWDGLFELLVMHLNRLDLRGKVGWGELDSHTGLEDTSLDSSNWNCTDTRDLVDILEWKSEWLLNRSLWLLELIEGFIESFTFVPRHVGGLLDHVVTVPSRDWDELDFLDLVTGLFKEGLDLLLDLLESGFGVVDSLLVHLVDTDDHLLDTEGVSKESVLSGLTVLRDTSLELTLGGCDHEDSTISLGSTSDHVLDEISMAGSIDNGEVVLLGLELPEGDIDGDTSFSL